MIVHAVGNCPYCGIPGAANKNDCWNGQLNIPAICPPTLALLPHLPSTKWDRYVNVISSPAPGQGAQHICIHNCLQHIHSVSEVQHRQGVSGVLLARIIHSRTWSIPSIHGLTKSSHTPILQTSTIEELQVQQFQIVRSDGQSFATETARNPQFTTSKGSLIQQPQIGVYLQKRITQKAEHTVASDHSGTVRLLNLLANHAPPL